MVALETHTTANERIIALLDDLPDSALAEVVSFVEFQRYKVGQQSESLPRSTRFLPTPMGGLWKGYEITSEDIAEARREMWGRFADDAQ